MAAQDAELKLKVSLDLGFFRQQLAGLGQAAAGYNLPVKVEFDRRSVQDELNALQRNIRRRNYTLNVNTNLTAEITKADTLARKLGELSRKIQSFRGGTGVASGRQAVAQIEEVLRGGLSGQAFGLQRAQENIAKQAILSRLEKESLKKGGGYNIPGLEKIIRDLGGTPSGKRSDLVAQAKKLVEESDGIADAVFDNLKDLQMKLRPIRGQAQTSAARSMPNLNRMLDQIANLTENPRAAQRMLRMLPENRITTDLIGAANRQAAFKEQFPSGYRLPGFNAPKAFDPLLKAIAKDFSDYAKSVNIADPWVGKIGDGIRRIVAVSAQAATTTKALPPIGGTTSPLNTLEQKLAQSRGMLGTGGGVAGAMFTGRGVVNPGLSMLPPVGISGSYRQMAAALANQAANPSLAHRQIADIGFGGVPTAATGLSGQALNRALNQAFLQRRGLSGVGSQTMPLFQTAGVPIQQTIPGMAYRMGGGTMGGSMGMFPMAGMMGPSTPLTINARTSMFGAGGPPSTPPPGGSGGGFMGGAGGFGRAMGSLNLPGAGAIRELGSEFAFATKQVLLFGQAYKVLGFAQDFPMQVGAAVSQLQSFRNTLLSVTGSAGAAADANEFILAAVEKYSIPLQAARDGFTKLFASMEPAGFAAGEIQNLFLGISKAAATYGMSADKVDRVNYAFAQMASKGQVMSEELKGQLGDVLPGAMGIFAKAAGFEGADAIQKFSKALEDGEYKGGKMRELLRNVANEMNREFGPGAEGAARTFQGALNRMQTATAKLYESFEPVAISVMNAAMVPFVQTLKNATDGINAYFSGQQAATPAAQGFTDILKTLVPTLTGIGENLKYVFQQVVVLIQGFGAVALQVGRLLALPIVRYLASAYIQTLLLTTGFKALATSGLGAALVAIARFIAQGVVYAQVTLGMRVATQQTTLAMYQFGITVQTVMVKSVIGIAIVAISALIGRIIELRGQLAAISGDAKSMEDLAKSSAKLGDVGGTREAVGNLRDRLNTYRRLKKEIAAAKQVESESMFSDRGAIHGGIEVSTTLASKLVELGIISSTSLSKTAGGYKILELTLGEINAKIDENIASFEKAGQKGSQYIDQAIKQNKKLREKGIMGMEVPGDKDTAKALRDAEQLAKQVQQRRIEEANFANDMQKITFDRDVQLSDAAFEHKKSLIDALNEYELSGLNDMQARQLKFAQDLKKIQLNAIDVVRKELQKANEAQMNVVAAQRTAEAAGSASAGGAAIFGETGRVSNAKDWVHGHFQTNTASLATLIGDVVPVVEQLLSQGIPVELSGGQKFNTRMSDAEITALLRKGATQHRHSGDGRSIDLFVPKGTTVPAPLSDVRNTGGRGGVTGVLPGSGQSWVGHLDPRSKSGTKQSSAAFSMETRSQKESQDLVKEQAKASAQLALRQLEIQNALKLAYAQTATVIKANIDSIFPVEKQKLDLRLQQSRHTLLMQGMPQEYIDYEEKRAVATKEAAMAEKVMRDNLNEAKAELKVYNDAVARGTKLSVEQQANVTRLTGSIAALEEGLLDSALQQREYNIVALEGAIATMKQADALKAMEEISGRVNDAVSGVVGTYKTLFKEIATGTNSVEALKKAQDALADRALTMFLDFAMKPVEDFFRKTLGSIFGVPDEETKRKETLAKLEAQLAVQKEIAASTKQTAINTGQGATMPSGATQGQAMGLASPAGDSSFSYGGGNISPLTDFISGQFATDLSSGLNSLQSSADAYASALSTVDASVRNSTINISNAAEEAGPNGATGKKWQESLGKTVQGIGIAAGSIMGIAAGISQVKKGGTANVLGGIGSILLSVGGAIGGFGKLFGVKGFATGGIASGGFVPFRAFANGGTVQGPTLGLVGEGRYNEAVVPLPDGKSIPVQLGGSSSRDLISPSSGANVSPVLSMSFETTTINGVEYVSRDQLETAMMETRRLAAKDGANRGAALAIDRLQHSPNTRRRIGMR